VTATQGSADREQRFVVGLCNRSARRLLSRRDRAKREVDPEEDAHGLLCFATAQPKASREEGDDRLCSRPKAAPGHVSRQVAIGDLAALASLPAGLVFGDRRFDARSFPDLMSSWFGVAWLRLGPQRPSTALTVRGEVREDLIDLVYWKERTSRALVSRLSPLLPPRRLPAYSLRPSRVRRRGPVRVR